jgi:hypothetical protein
MPSRYNLSFWLYNVSGTIYDALEHYAFLDVEASDFYGSGKGITSQNGIIFLPFKWNLDGLNNRQPAVNADTH